MNHLTERPSPLISSHDLAGHGMPRDPAEHTEEELAALVALLLEQQKPRTETVGHSRDAASRAAAAAFASLQDSRLPALAGPETVHAMRGATADGGTWDVHGGWLTSWPGQVPS
ncbi:hypothetical protein ACIQM3_34250 [Streptomyces sp. NPDC091271]|uniref:hypothetical protein n=1 Tax=Streptomyces sp. NPDC091271 TaxID=3365980 RepID=UPI0038120A84